MSLNSTIDPIGRDVNKEEFCQNLTGLEVHMNEFLSLDVFKNKTYTASHKCACSELGGNETLFSIDCSLEAGNSTSVRTEQLMFELSEGKFNFNQSLSSWKDLTSRPLETVGNNGIQSDLFPLAACQGDCDTDDECQEGLKCFQRGSDKGKAIPPGCEGEDDTENDFCYDPTADVDSQTGLFAQTYDFGVITAVTHPSISNRTETPSTAKNSSGNITAVEGRSKGNGFDFASARAADFSNDASILFKTGLMTSPVLVVVTWLLTSV